MKRKPFAASPGQRDKCHEAPCRVCHQGPCDPAHVIPRSLGGCDEENCVVPLCRRHHREYDEGRLDLLSVVTREEQMHAVEHVGIARAFRRIANQRLAA